MFEGIRNDPVEVRYALLAVGLALIACFAAPDLLGITDHLDPFQAGMTLLAYGIGGTYIGSAIVISLPGLAARWIESMGVQRTRA